MDDLHKIPFLRLLIPFLCGIFLQYFLLINNWSVVFISIGILTTLLSFLVKKKNEYNYRWVFGCGLCFILISIGMFCTWMRQYQNTFPFSEAHDTYTGYILDIPQVKPNTLALNLYLEDYGRKVICYVPKDSLSYKLKPGDYISIFSQVKPFDKLGNVGPFDYSKYMYNKGFCGYTMVNNNLWEFSKRKKYTLKTTASLFRSKIIDFYNSLNLEKNQTALLASLTLGYTSNLSDDIVQDFRDAGVAHILAVSGLHIGIVYIVILSLFRNYNNPKIKQYLVIVLLWIYIFIVGLPPSAVRAGIMLTLFSISLLLNRKAYSYNSIFAAAFIILFWNPLLFFDLGFQLSFVAILSIKIFMPIIEAFCKTKNRIIKAFWKLFSLSFAAQLGLLPLTLYYFGTFPLYFLFANMLIVPFVSISIYLILITCFIYGAQMLIKSFFVEVLDVLIYSIKLLLNYIINVANFFAKIPYAVIDNIEISLPYVFLYWLFMLSLYFAFKTISARNIKMSLSCLLLIFTLSLYTRYTTRNTFTIYKEMNKIKAVNQVDMKRVWIAEQNQNRILKIGQEKLLLLENSTYFNMRSNRAPFKIDYLYLETNEVISISEILTLFDIKKIIFGNRISQKTVKRLKQECEKKRIPYYDVYESGNLTINF